MSLTTPEVLASSCISVDIRAETASYKSDSTPKSEVSRAEVRANGEKVMTLPDPRPTQRNITSNSPGDGAVVSQNEKASGFHDEDNFPDMAHAESSLNREQNGAKRTMV